MWDKLITDGRWGAPGGISVICGEFSLPGDRDREYLAQRRHLDGAINAPICRITF
jgi:hypothetical protein